MLFSCVCFCLWRSEDEFLSSIRVAVLVQGYQDAAASGCVLMRVCMIVLPLEMQSGFKETKMKFWDYII